MKPDLVLGADEQLAWQARPAPRCYTFRAWRHALFGIIFLGICSFWQVLGIQMAETYAIAWPAWLPLPFVLLGLCLAFGRLLLARLEWEHVHYAITDRRLLVQRGLLRRRNESLELAEITYFRLQPHGEQLGTLQVHKGKDVRLTLHCIEHPGQAAALLENAMADRLRSAARVESE